MYIKYNIMFIYYSFEFFFIEIYGEFFFLERESEWEREVLSVLLMFNLVIVYINFNFYIGYYDLFMMLIRKVLFLYVY